MKTIDSIPLTWRDRDAPLVAAAVVAHAGAAHHLAESARSRLRAGANLSAASAVGFLVIIGDEADLPWSDGATYLGWESAVLVPTTQVPEPATALLSDAARRFADVGSLVIVLPDMVLYTPIPRPLSDPSHINVELGIGAQ